MKKCLNCETLIVGRSDKLFCDGYCKSSFHYKKKKEKEKSLFKTIDNQIKTNRRLLKLFNKAGKAVIRKEELIAEGFNPKYFTHFGKIKKETFICFVTNSDFFLKLKMVKQNTF